MLRGIAATSIVFYHTGFFLFGTTHTDFAAVPLFFVISGFIMCYIAKNKPEFFLLSRIVRIVPAYWLCTLIVMFLAHRWTVFRPWSWDHDLAAHALKSFFFLPSDRLPILGVGWTLNYEMFFYSLFGIALAVTRRWAPLIVVGLLLGTSLVTSTYGLFYLAQFAAGIVVFHLVDWIAPLRRGPVMAIGACVVVSCYAAMAFDAAPVAIVYAIPSLVVAVAVTASASGADISAKWAISLGDASYSIYLTHTIAMPFLGGIEPLNANISWALCVTAVCVGIGIAAHYMVERPMTAWFKGHLRLYEATPKHDNRRHVLARARAGVVDHDASGGVLH